MSGTIKEDKLLKGLDALEEWVLKGGDPLADRDPEGGFSTEGTPLSGKVPRGTGVTKGAESESPEGEEESASPEDESASPEGNEGESESPMEPDLEKRMDEGEARGGRPVTPAQRSAYENSPSNPRNLAQRPAYGATTPPASRPPASSQASTKIGKSFMEEAMQDENIRKSIEVSDFLESQVETTARAIDGMRESIADIELSLASRLQKSEGAQADFNTRLAKAVVRQGKLLEKAVETIDQIRKAMDHTPAMPARRGILSKSEILDPEREQLQKSGNRDEVIEWMNDKVQKGELPPAVLIHYELDGYSVERLPMDVRKALENDLNK
jgi:hypothetical protein